MLLDIVAKSLYSDKEVFIRELISNASDAIEKLRYLELTDESLSLPAPEHSINITTDKQNRILEIQDTGIGLTKQEMIDNLGTLARSGSKAFLSELKEKAAADPGAIIGQFGVGFYSCFMVADKVTVISQSSRPESKTYKWSTDTSGTYSITETGDAAEPGTRIIVSLKPHCREFCDEATVKEVIKKYSNFVSSPVKVNGTQINTIQPLWLSDSKDISPEMHDEFYRFIGNTYDRPRFTLHYKIDAPLNIRCLLYFPEVKPGLFEMSREMDVGVSLYCRRVLIKNRADNILPKWLRFVKGVVDSEDIPLNLSRELLQDSALIRKLRTVLTNRVLRFLQERSVKEPEKYGLFIKDYGIFLKEGIISGQEEMEKEEVAKLLMFESSTMAAGEKVSLPDYCSRMKPGQRDIYYLSAPSRALALSSPYFEALRSRDVEVLLCYEPYDELTLMQLRQFNRLSVTSVEKEMRQEKETVDLDKLGNSKLSKQEATDTLSWLQTTLGPKVASVKPTLRLSSHPAVVTVEEMAAARHFVRTQFQQIPEEQRFQILQPQLEVNLSHPLIEKMSLLRVTDQRLAELLAEQLFAMAMINAGLVDDPRTLVSHLTELLTRAFDKNSSH